MNIIDRFKNLNHETKVFYIFLAVHLIVWTGVALIRNVMPADSLEGVWWGSLMDFGSPKHPPLAAWLTYFAYAPLKLDFCVYLMSQLFIIGGFIYTYRLSRYFLDENKSMLSVILLEGCWIYSYITGYYGFNPDVVLLFTLPAITYYFYNCMKDDKPSDWLKMAILVGLSLLNKYQTILLVAGMALWALIFNRKVFKNKWFYISVIIAFLIFLPHILWLIKYEFFPILYYDRELNLINGYNHLTSPLMFIGMQVVMCLGTLLIYGLYRLKFRPPLEFIKDYDRKQFWFLLLLCFVPFFIHVLIGLYYGSDIRPRWGYVFWYMLGTMLFYFFPVKIGKNDFDFIVKGAYTVMLIIFLSLGTLLTVEKNYGSRYPVDTVFSDLKSIWAESIDTPLKYVGGDSTWSFPITIYGDTHPINIMDTFGYKNPWIDEEDLKQSGAIIIDKFPMKTLYWAKLAAPYLPENYRMKLNTYRFVIHNALGQPREYRIYYIIIPPIK